MIAPAKDPTRSLRPSWKTGTDVDERALAEWAGAYALDRIMLTGTSGPLVECLHQPGADIARSATPTQGELQSGSALEVRVILGALQAAYIWISGFGTRRALLYTTHTEETPSSSAASIWERSSTHDDQQRWLQAQSDLVRVLTATSADRSPALVAFDELRDWLHLPIPDVARLVGVSRSAPMYWRRQRAAPRPSVAGRLYRVHALVRALRDAVPTEPPLAMLQRRPPDGGLSAYELLCAGQYDEAERLLRPLIFPTSDQAPKHRRLIAWDEDGEPGPPTELPLRPPVRRARRVTLPT